MKLSSPRADKSLGQHFLHDQTVISKICEDHQDKAKFIVEVGPGPGALTKELAQKPQAFIVVEKDQRFEAFLKELVGEKKVYLQDALKINLQEVLEQNNAFADVWLVSNLPYNVGVPLMLSFVKTQNVRWMTLMFQKEVAQKVLNFSNKKNSMGSLMAIMQTYFEVKLLCQVPPGAFSPPPQVDSSVLSFSRKENPIIPLSDFSPFESFLRVLFQFKRKQVLKNLKTNYSAALATKALEAAGLKTTDRAEVFKLEQVHLLYRELQKEHK